MASDVTFTSRMPGITSSPGTKRFCAPSGKEITALLADALPETERTPASFRSSVVSAAAWASAAYIWGAPPKGFIWVRRTVVDALPEACRLSDDSVAES